MITAWNSHVYNDTDFVIRTSVSHGSLRFHLFFAADMRSAAYVLCTFEGNASVKDSEGHYGYI